MSLPFKGLKCGERLIKHLGILICYVIRTEDIHQWGKALSAVLVKKTCNK